MSKQAYKEESKQAKTQQNFLTVSKNEQMNKSVNLNNSSTKSQAELYMKKQQIQEPTTSEQK